MNFLSFIWLLIFGSCSTVPKNNGEVMENDLKSLMLGSYIQSTEYEAPEGWKIDLSVVLFEKLLSVRNFTNEDVYNWSMLGLQLQEVSQARSSYAVISEPIPTEGHGHGFYAIKMRSSVYDENFETKVFQAPHRPSDAYTHEIIYELFTAGNFTAAAWSTTHRDNVDLCKHESSYFNSFTVATVRVFGSKARVVQLHGFNKHSHETSADVIFSSSKSQIALIPPEFNSIATCLKSSLNPWNVFKYPQEINFLGGTLNINAAKLYEANKDAIFYHVETSKELREELLVNDNLKDLFYKCF